MDWTLEVVSPASGWAPACEGSAPRSPFSDVDRAIAFYRDQVGFAPDHDTHAGEMCFSRDRAARSFSATCRADRRCSPGR
jgi:hypothetical protein